MYMSSAFQYCGVCVCVADQSEEDLTYLLDMMETEDTRTRWEYILGVNVLIDTII